MLLGLAVIGTLAGLAWAWQLGGGRAERAWDGRPLVMLASLWGGLALAAWAWWRTPSGRLTWDGGAWAWSGARAGTLHSVHLVADLQFTVLLRLADARGRTLGWLWAERSAAPGLWKPLRRALLAGTRRVPRPGREPADGGERA